MATMICPTCESRCEFKNGKYKCSSCRNIYDGFGIDDSIIDKLNFANEKRIQDYDFDGALKKCEEILAEDPKNLGANWCALLAKYQVAYLKDKKDKYIATFMNPEIGSLKSSTYYRNLNVQYQSMADEIESSRLSVVAQFEKVPNYKIFISYKSDSIDEKFAEQLYKELNKNEKYHNCIFFAKECLGKYGEEWEPHIYNALKSANVLILLGSSVSNISSEWVANEWKRFIAYKNMGENKALIVGVGQKVDPYQLPGTLPKLQLERVLPFQSDEQDKEWLKILIEKTDKAFKSFDDMEALTVKAKMMIRGKHFGRASKLYKRILETQPKNASAHWGILKCRLKAFDDYDIAAKSKGKGLERYKEYTDALNCASGELKENYRAVNLACIEKRANNYKDNRDNYKYYIEHSKVQRVFKKISIVAAVLIIGAFGVYSYFGISNPVSYSVENGQATLSGKSIYFNLVVNDLEVDTYKDYPVVKIGDGALKNSSIQSVKMSESVKEIGVNAFENCTKLTTVDIPNCTYIGANAFNSCTNLTELTIGITDTTVIGENAFTNLGKNVTVSVPTIAEKATAQLKETYPDISFTTYTKDKVEECVYFINKLSSVSSESETDIQKAESLYNALSSAEKSRITNYGVLQNARASYNAVTAINAIGTITLNSANAITEAENLYNALTAEQKQTVSNYTILTTARAVYNTMAQIAEIGEVQINSEPKIVKAEELYFALSYEQRDLVTNYSTLTAARTRVDTLLADAVIAQINTIGTVITVDSETLISTAEAAYNALSDAQKNRVSNYATLTDARAVYNVVKAIDNIGAITINSGNTITIAQTLYDGLTSAQKLKILNYSDLTDANAVYHVVLLIGTIGTVMPDSISSIEMAETAYASLSALQKTKVSNYTVLTDSRTAYGTVTLIQEIGTVSENSLSKIETAQNSYDGLSDAQQRIVGNYSKLSDSKTVYDVIVAINAIGDVSISSSSKISAVESAYSALTSAQKELVPNSETLTTARSIYNVMTVIQSQGTVRLGSGTNYSYQTLSTSNMVTVLNNASNREEVDSITLTGLVKFENQDYWTSAFKNLNLVRYDVTGGTSRDSFEFTPSRLTYRLIGSTNTYNIALKASSGDELNLEFESFNITNSGTVLDVTKVGQTNIKFLTATDLKGGNNNIPTINAKNLTLNLVDNVTVNISASDGTSEVGGGVGINAANLSLNGRTNSYLTVKGGNGVDGVNGQNGTDGKDGGWGANGTSGTSGTSATSGTDGGDAIITNIVEINFISGKIIVVGGNGGNAGNGGYGGKGGNAGAVGWGMATGDTRSPGQAGNGGNGGNGGSGGHAINVNTACTLISGDCILQGGNGKIGGNGGAGGNGGNGGENTWNTAGRGTGSNGGNGGNGGDGGNGGRGCTQQVQKSNSAILTNSNGTIGAAGTGGNGGNGGAGGGGSNKTGKAGVKGQDGVAGI